MRQRTSIVVLGLLLSVQVSAANIGIFAPEESHLSPFDLFRIALHNNSDERGGTELGSGREFLRRLSEQYGLGIGRTLERYLVDRVSRIVPPLFGGGPNDWHVGVDDETNIQNLEQIVYQKIENEKWEAVYLGRYIGIKLETITAKNDELIHTIRTEFLHGRNYVQIEVTGTSNVPRPATFEEFQRSLSSLPLMN